MSDVQNKQKARIEVDVVREEEMVYAPLREEMANGVIDGKRFEISRVLTNGSIAVSIEGDYYFLPLAKILQAVYALHDEALTGE